VFRVLGDEQRLKIVALLSQGELCVCNVQDALGVSQPTASRHLGVLRAAGLVESTRRGAWVYYALARQSDHAVERVLRDLVKGFPADQLQAAIARAKGASGPDACR
jgi:ArsR family transcriptional regulator